MSDKLVEMISLRCKYCNAAIEVTDPKGAFEPRNVRIIRVHLEEDAGKSMHDETAGTADSRIDLNRTGTPLCEIVTEPDLRSPIEARAWLNELKLLLVYLGVNLRCERGH